MEQTPHPVIPISSCEYHGILRPALQSLSQFVSFLQEGPIKPGCNPIIVLMNRIKEVGRTFVASTLFGVSRFGFWARVLKFSGSKLRA